MPQVLALLQLLEAGLDMNVDILHTSAMVVISQYVCIVSSEMVVVVCQCSSDG
jgi:hypothetical protein